jgi:hypothetical protein
MPSEGSTEITGQVLVVGFWLIFVGSVLGKLDGWNRWSSLTSALPLPRHGSSAVRILLPLVEAVVAVVLIVDPAAGLAASALLLAVFAVAVVIFARRIGPAECGCFGALTPTKLGNGLAVRNALLAIVAAVGVAVALGAERPRPPLPALVLGLVVGFWFVLAIEYVRLVRSRVAHAGGDS